MPNPLFGRELRKDCREPQRVERRDPNPAVPFEDLSSGYLALKIIIACLVVVILSTLAMVFDWGGL